MGTGITAYATASITGLAASVSLRINVFGRPGTPSAEAEANSTQGEDSTFTATIEEAIFLGFGFLTTADALAIPTATVGTGDGWEAIDEYTDISIVFTNTGSKTETIEFNLLASLVGGMAVTEFGTKSAFVSGKAWYEISLDDEVIESDTRDLFVEENKDFELALAIEKEIEVAPGETLILRAGAEYEGEVHSVPAVSELGLLALFGALGTLSAHRRR